MHDLQEDAVTDLDVLIRNVRVVRPDLDTVEDADIAIANGTIVAVEPGDPAPAGTVVDGGGKLAYPGAVDAHQHWGIYNPLDVDTTSEFARRRAGRSHHWTHLHAHRSVLPQQER